MAILSIACLSIFLNVDQAVAGYRIGVGRADCTGPSVEVIFVSIVPIKSYCYVQDIECKKIFWVKESSRGDSEERHCRSSLHQLHLFER